MTCWALPIIRTKKRFRSLLSHRTSRADAAGSAGWSVVSGLRVLQLGCCLLVALTVSDFAHAYEAKLHQKLTFLAAKQFNECMNHYGLARTSATESRAGLTLSALDTRYLVKANMAQADTNLFTRMFRWNYYNRHDQSNRSFLGVIDTRFHNRFDDLVQRLDGSRSRRHELQTLGRIVSYLQDVTSPARVVPVYTGRWWRFSTSDRFDRFKIDEERVAAAVAQSCSYVVAPPSDYAAVLADAAADTLTAVQAPIFGFPTTWEAYWKLSEEPEEFGEYGVAGNQFGQRTQFRCSENERCLLLDDDPLYQDFATARHVAAVLATMQALSLFHSLGVPDAPELSDTPAVTTGPISQE